MRSRAEVVQVAPTIVRDRVVHDDPNNYISDPIYSRRQTMHRNQRKNELKESDSHQHSQLAHLKRKLEDLEEVHRDGKRVVRLSCFFLP